MTTSSIVFGVELSSFDNVGRVACIAQASTESMLTAYAALIGTTPTYGQWEAARVKWCEGYIDQLGETPKENTIHKAWSRFAAGLAELGLTKPKADTPASTEKANTEAKKASALDAALTAYNLTKEATVAELATAAKAAIDAGDFATQKVLSGEADKRNKAILAAQEKAAKEAEKAKQPSAVLKRINDKIKGYDAAELLALEALLDTMLPSDIIKKAKIKAA